MDQFLGEHQACVHNGFYNLDVDGVQLLVRCGVVAQRRAINNHVHALDQFIHVMLVSCQVQFDKGSLDGSSFLSISPDGIKRYTARSECLT